MVERFRSPGIRGMSHAKDLNALAGCLFLHRNTACLHLWDAHHDANTVVVCVYYS